MSNFVKNIKVRVDNTNLTTKREASSCCYG